jgi:phosphohistidine swiveling domain-containing protein
MTEGTLPSPFECSPPGCEGWEEMYPRHALFHDDRRGFDEARFWFQDGMHWPDPVRPFDAVVVEALFVGLNQTSARTFAIPPSLGAEYRLLAGYVYSSPNVVTDAAAVDQRAELFERRGGYYYRHWDELYARWVDKVQDAIAELRELEVPEMQNVEDKSTVTTGRGYGSSHALLVAYARLLESVDRVIQYHFELLNVGYAAYVPFYAFCRQAFPDIADQAIAGLVSGVDLLPLRPDEELKRLAGLAIELGVADDVKAADCERRLRIALAESTAGVRWLASLDAAKEPWFYFSYGNGLASHHRSWIDDTTLPLATIASYIRRLEAGEAISRPRDAVVAERDRMTAEYRELLPEPMRGAFDEQLALARTVFSYVENHSFYVDHWYLTVFWNKVRDFGALLASRRFLAEADDVFYLRHDELHEALHELRLAWSSGDAGAPLGPGYWPEVVNRRKSIHEAQRRWPPPVALGGMPEAVTDPVTVMLFGVTPERVEGWLASTGGPRAATLTGIAASPGVAEGRARLIADPKQLADIEDGEVLVAASTSPSWTPVFSRVSAVVVDIGGIMCHAAILAREYGLPTVVGTGSATKRIQTGDRIRVDGHTGVVTVLD